MEKRNVARASGYSVTEYCEIFCKVRQVSHVWIKQNANAELKRIAVMLGKNLGVDVLVVSK